MPVRPLVSIVAPAFNEADGIDAFLDQTIAAMGAIGEPYEIIVVDDGSRDDTVLRVARRCAGSSNIKLLRLSRNFGKEAALNAGLAHASGAAVVQIDSDLQHPPEVIADLLAQWREGGEIVYAQRRSRESDPLLRRLATGAFYRLFGAISDVQLMPGLGDFLLLDRRVVDAMLRLPERERFTKGLYAWVGFRRVAVPFDVAPRQHGRSSFRPGRLVRLGMDAVTAFGSLPLRIWTYVGLTLALIGLGYAIFVTLRTLIFGVETPGYASLMVAICFFSGVQLIGIGLIGEYLGRVLVEVKQRPLYIVSEALGFEPAAALDEHQNVEQTVAHLGRRAG
ncbi:MAG: glycosyltransferase family 2 protein [Pikeienuella sp.]